MIGIGVFRKPEVEKFEAVLPGATFAEKDGTIVNFEGREQKLRRAIVPPGQSKQLSEILMMWANSTASAGGAA
jgi:NADH-quinone oxidoreductase subunit G